MYKISLTAAQRSAVALITGLSLPTTALAADAQTLAIRSLAATCANCHGTNGHALPDASVPGLAGRESAEIVAQMQAFRSGARPATIMHQIAKGYSDAQIQSMADYFAKQK
jgi:cytochrome c553